MRGCEEASGRYVTAARRFSGKGRIFRGTSRVPEGPGAITRAQVGGGGGAGRGRT